MRLTIVGCSGSMSGPRSAASSYLLQAEHEGRTWSLVLDLGPGAFGQLWNYVDPRQIDAVIASHYHADHIGDIISMQVYRRWYPTGPIGPVEFWGPAGAHERLRQIEGCDEHVDYSGEFTLNACHDLQTIEIGPFTIQFFATWHTVESYAVRISAGGKSFVYTGDTDLCDGVVAAASDVDFLLSECAFCASDVAPAGIHMTGERVAQLVTRANVKRVALTHIQPWTDPQVSVAECRAALENPNAVSVVAVKPGERFEI